MRPERTKFSQITRVLRNRLLNGTYAGKLPGERVLARELHTNPKTVRVALVQLEGLGLLQRRQRSGTFAVPPEELARGAPIIHARMVLRPPCIKLGEADFAGSMVLYGCLTAAEERGVTVALRYTEDVDDAVAEALREAASPGFLGTCMFRMPLETRHIIELSNADGPVLLADEEIEVPLIPFLSFDYEGAGRLAAQHLMELGHRRIAYIYYTLHTPRQRKILEGVEHALAQVGLTLVQRVRYLREDPGVLKVLLEGDERPSAVISAGYFMAESLIELALGLGRRIPEDLSVVTFLGNPSGIKRHITRVRLDHELLGRRALEILFDEDLVRKPRVVLLPVGLVDRDVTAMKLKE